MIDSHAHLTDRRLSPIVLDVRKGYLESGVSTVLDVGCSVSSSLLAKQNAESFSEVYFTAGCHPDDAGSVNATTLLQIKELSAHKKCLAIGEIGLDYHYLNFDKTVQKNAFISQLELAIELQKPVVIHTRDACKDTVDILSTYAPKLKGFIMHCYSESKETAKTLLNLGAYFSFGGVVTFKNAKKDEIIKSIPINRILLETDCPYMAPVPHRGELNKPEYVSLVYDKVKDIYGVDKPTLINRLRENFNNLFM
jgi:TatD DNase family protein